MKAILISFTIVFIFACRASKPESSLKNFTTSVYHNFKRDTLYIRDTVFADCPDHMIEYIRFDFGMTKDPKKDTIFNKPVYYYISDENCAEIASDFYYGQFTPSDDGATDELLKYVYNDNRKLRPFYRWCLEKTREVADGALVAHLSIPMRKYVEKYPKEFFNYIDLDSSGKKYMHWASYIGYYGYYSYERNSNEKALINLTKKMQSNCSNCNRTILTRIRKFAKDCYNSQ